MKSKLLQEIIKDPTERDIAIDTGCYNSYIKGYLIYTLESMNKAPSEIKEAAATLSQILDTTSAKEAREKAQK